MKLIRVLFVCHGNICRSPMCQSVLQDMVERRGIADGFLIDSRATSRDIADPWYTDDFDATYRDVTEGCEAFLRYLDRKDRI